MNFIEVLTMRFLRRHWYDKSAAISLLILAGVVIFWKEFGVLQRLLILNLGVIFLHFFEEFGFPGGFPKLANALLFPSSNPDRYPLNQNSVMIGNWFFALAFYLPPIFFPKIIWLGLMPILFGGVGQLLAHAVIVNRKLGTWYNSGLATTLFGHVPIAFCYIAYVQKNNLASAWDWVIAIVYAVFAYAVLFRRLVISGLADVNSPYPFDEGEMSRLDKYRTWASVKSV